MPAGPSLIVGQLAGLTLSTPVDFPVRPTIAGAAFTAAATNPYTNPTITASGQSGTGAVTTVNTQSVTYGTTTTLDFTATTTPTATGLASFNVALPGRVTNFAALTDARVIVSGKDVSLNIINNAVGAPNTSGTNVNIQFNVNGSSAWVQHNLDVRVVYQAI